MKLPAIVVAVGVAAAVASGTASAQAAADLAGVREYVKTYQTTWNTHDAAALAASFAEDADMVFGNMPAARGRGAIEAWWRTYFERQEPERRATFDVTSARILAPDVALVNLTSTTGGVGADGAALLERDARGTWLVRRHGGTWLIEAMCGLPTENDRVELIPTLETTRTLMPSVRAFVAEYEEVFNRHDPDALAALYLDDADIVVRERPAAHGAREIRSWWRGYFGQPRPYRAVLIIEDIRAVSDDVALVNVIGTGSPLEATRRLAPSRQTRAMLVLRRVADGWRVAALRVLPAESDRVIRESDRPTMQPATGRQPVGTAPSH